MHLRCILESKIGKHFKRAVHARRLVRCYKYNTATSIGSKAVNMISMLRVLRLVHDYTSTNVQGDQISACLLTTTTSPNKQRILAYYLIHICLWLRRLHGRYIFGETLRLLESPIFRFYDARFGYLSPSFIKRMYHFIFGRYEHIRDLIQPYLSMISPIYLNLIVKQPQPIKFYQLESDLSYHAISCPFDIVGTLS